MAQSRYISKVGNISELVNMSTEDRARYSISIDTYRTNLSVMQNERAEGIEEGIKKGRAEGRAEERLANARALKANGIPVALIASSLKLSADEFAQL